MIARQFQYRKRYGLHAIRRQGRGRYRRRSFQYRKRYGLHAMGFRTLSQSKYMVVSIPQAVWIACNRANVMLSVSGQAVSIPQAVWIACNAFLEVSDTHKLRTFQYRKRYGLHAITRPLHKKESAEVSIPQAVWIACNTHTPSQAPRFERVSIPQAVWIACN